MGYSPYSANLIVSSRYQDIFKYKKTTLREKLWAQKRGFTSDRISYFGLTDENYKDFLSDFDYYWLHPLNGAYTKWIDDKLSIKYILQPFSRYLPEYYYHIYNNEILRLMDCPKGYQQTIQDIINLLKSKGMLAAKLISSSGGAGFYKLDYDDQDFLINDQKAYERDVDELIRLWQMKKDGEYIITEYIEAHKDLRKIWDKAPGTIRILVVRKKNQPPKIISSSIRFGTNASGIVDNVQAGAVLCIIDGNSGCFSDGIIRSGDVDIESKFHPDTKVLLEGILPNWDLIKDGILSVSSYIPQVKYMGFDVIVTDEGFRIIEINSLPGVSYLQCHSPFLKNEISKDFFFDLLKEKKEGLKK